MKLKTGRVLMALLGWGGLLAAAASAQEKAVTMKELPPAVQATVKEQSAGAKLRGLAMKTENGKTFYEAALLVNGRTKEILIDADGNVVEVETQARLSELPPAVQATVKEQSAGAKLRGVAMETENGKAFYEAELLVNGRIKDVSIDADGKVVEVEEQVRLSELPPAVRAEIVKQAGKGRVDLVETVKKNGVLIFYEAHLKSNGQIKEVKVSPDGKPIQ